MITANIIRRCANLSSVHLQPLIKEKDRLVIGADFVGVTNGGEFCYTYLYPSGDSKTGLAADKVFVRINDQDQLEAV